MKKLSILFLCLFAFGCTQPKKVTPKVVAVKPARIEVIKPDTKPEPAVVDNSLVDEVDNSVVAPEPTPEPVVVAEPIIPAPVVEKDCQCVDCGCKNGKPCKNGGETCKCPNCECDKAKAEEVPPQKPQPTIQAPPRTFSVPPVPAGYVRSYFWRNGVKWYRDTPVQAQQSNSGASCASGNCGSSSGRRAILPWRN